MFKALLRLVLIVVALLLLAIAAAILLLQTSAGASVLENRLRAWLHPSVQIEGPVSFSVFPELSVEVRDIKFPVRLGTNASVSIEQTRVQMQWLPLLDREVQIDDLYIQGVRLSESAAGASTGNSSSRSVMPQATSALQEWLEEGWRHSDAWQLLLSQMLVEDVAVIGNGQHTQLPLASLRQLQVSGNVMWPVTSSGSASLGIRDLSVDDPDAFGHTPALLEQLGIANNGSWHIATLDSQWRVNELNQGEVDPTELLIESLTASGMWGDVSANDGRIDLRTGQVSIPMQATLTNAPKFKGRGFEVNVRQSNMRFELTGTVAEPGLQWLNQLR